MFQKRSRVFGMDRAVEGLGGDMTVIVHELLMKGRRRGNRWGI